MPLIQELKELWQGYHFQPTSTEPSGSFIIIAIITSVVDVVAMRKLTGFLSHTGNHLCNFFSIHKDQIEEIGPQFHYTTHTQIMNQPSQNGFRNPNNKDKQFSLSMECDTQS
ncbi:hypothetical protein O181_005620 [Austropuccinia psidii MF-1]|uniref:Uncharacterized protein n=1 Tax=Austropuccinia psidii MF-1 TaxID=1389203 RepID=A0A9Q3BIQ8_9BASI|nr:hypothetical protein [Austropuccinia psidii MF-1]